MAKKKNNFKGIKTEELQKSLLVFRESLRVLHFKSEGSKSKNVKEQSSLRKQIARVLTEINHPEGRASKNNINKQSKK